MIQKTEQEIMKNWGTDVYLPLVSVCTITYNHESYISKTLESLLHQETDFPFEILIDEDYSTDNTADIISSYAKKYPKIIKANLRTKNVGMKINGTENLQRATGKYTAICEGDDYWTNPLKLQKQVDFLEKNPLYAGCFHDCLILHEKKDSSKTQHVKIGNRKIDVDVDLAAVIKENNIATASIVYRNTIKDMPKFYSQNIKGDYALMIIIASSGPIKYLPEVMSAYRVHDGGVWSSKSQIYQEKENINFYTLLQEHFINDSHVLEAINKKKKYVYYSLARKLVYEHQRLKSLYYIMLSLDILKETHSKVKYYPYFKEFLKSILR